MQQAIHPSLELLADLRRDEGFRGTAYADPRSGGVPWTIAYGHTRDVKPGDTCTLDEGEAWLEEDATQALTACFNAWTWFKFNDPVRRDAVANMAFNMGIAKLKSFYNFLELLSEAHYQAAANDLPHTPWYKEVGDRAVRIAHMIATGARP